MCTLRRNVIRLSTLALALGACSDDSGGNGDSITFSVGLNPLEFAAAQVGDGPWEVITPAADGKYTVAASAETYGIVGVCANEQYATVTVLQATLADTRTPSIDCELFDDPSAVLSGTITGVAAASVVVHYYEVGFGPTYTMTAAPGTWDAFALDQPSFGELSRVVRKDAVTLTADAPAVVDFDFAADGFALESHSVTFVGTEPTDRISVSAKLRNRTGGTSFQLGMPAALSYKAIPASHLREDDLNVVTASLTYPDDGSTREVRRMFVAAQDFTATLPPKGPSPAIESESATPYLLLRGYTASGFDYDRLDFNYQQLAGNSGRMWTASLSDHYREATNIETYTLPDLSGLAGFDVGWGLVANQPVDWNVVTTVSDAGPGDLFEADQPASALDGRTHLVTQHGGRFPD